MSAAKHTPGPWFVFPRATVGMTLVEGGGAFSIGTTADEQTANILCTRFPWPEREEEMTANGHLIAATPEVLGALEIAARYVERVAGTSPTQGPGIERQRAAARDLKTIRAAIAKATGGAA